MKELDNIPEENVPDVVKIFIIAGKTKILIEKQPDGNWTVKGE